MLCQNCQKRVANVHFTQVINGRKVEMFLCEACAGEKGSGSFSAPLGLNDFLSALIGYSSSAVPQLPEDTEQIACPKCGMTFGEFQKIGKLGCGECYTAFGDRLRSILRRLHGDAEHNGKMSCRVSQGVRVDRTIEKLKQELARAVQGEEYEKAAKLRDEIKSLEAKRG